MLTEKEIEELLDKGWIGWDDFDEKTTAHAIFERMNEEVVWEAEAYVDGFGRVRFTTEDSNLSYMNDDGLILEEMFYPSLAGGKGSISGLTSQRVQVTVRRKPGVRSAGDRERREGANGTRRKTALGDMGTERTHDG